MALRGSPIPRHLAGASACLALGWLAFGRGEPVPLLRWVDLAFHETGHVLTRFMPAVVTASMGSVAQVAVPLAIALYFLRRSDLVGAGVCLAWAGTSARDVATYIADAPVQRLDLIAGEHDWATVLGPAHCDCLARSAEIASTVQSGGVVLVAAGVLACLAGLVLATDRARSPAPR